MMLKNCICHSLSTYGFSTLYITLAHSFIKDILIDLFLKKKSIEKALLTLHVTTEVHFLLWKTPLKYHAWSSQNVCNALTFLLDNIFIRFGTKVSKGA